MKRATAPPKPAVTSKPTAKASATAGLPGPAASEPVKYKFSAEDAEAQAADLIPADIQAGLADGQWKERLGAAERLLAWVEEGNADKAETEVIFRYLCKTPGWNEKNFQVGFPGLLLGFKAEWAAIRSRAKSTPRWVLWLRNAPNSVDRPLRLLSDP